MRYTLLLLLPIMVIAQVSQVPIANIGGKSEYGVGFTNLGEDTEIVMNNPKKDTVYTIDSDVMDVKPDKIALSETYYPLDVENVVVIDMSGRRISPEYIPIKGVVRAKLVKRGKKFIIVRIRVLKNPPIR